MRSRFLVNAVCILLFFFSASSFAQSSGYIVRPATGSGAAVLDPIAPFSYTSKTTAGFMGNDVANSKLAFKPISAFSTEPFGDLRRGADHLFTDFVPDPTGNGCYAYFDNTNLLFRFRMGTLVPGAKGYSILIDTDGKFGNSGTSADPNFQAATTGNNGNPGFEIEIVMETGSRVAIYNVDGANTPTLKKEYTAWQDYSQASIAGTFDNGDPDFFLDFYIPFADLQGGAFPFNIDATTNLRMAATTVMSPQAAIGGPKSDIYGLNDDNYPVANDEYVALINAQSPFRVADLSGNSTSPIGIMCTAAPVVSSATTGTGTAAVQGTWTKSLTGASNTATITVYKNNISIGTVANVSSGASWSLSNLTIVKGDVITARATGVNETNTCNISNAVTATSALSCTAATRPATLTNLCISYRGFSAAGWTAGHYISIWRITAAGNYFVAAGVPTGTNGSGFATDASLGAGGWKYSAGCTNGNGGFGGTYMVFDSIPGGCTSKPVFGCATNNQGSNTTTTTAVPVINNTASIYPTTLNITGTATAGSTINVYVDDLYVGNATLSGTSWSYTFTTPLITGQTIMVSAQTADPSATSFVCAGFASTTVKCNSAAPVITANSIGYIAAGLPITGVSAEPPGSTVRVYNAATNTVVATATVQSGGSWTTGAFNAVSGTAYYAKVQNGTCNESAASSTVTAVAATAPARCGTITTSTINATTTSVSGTLSTAVAGTTVKLYIDGNLIGTTTTGTTDWTITSIAAGKIYANGTLSIGVQEGTALEVMCSNTRTVSCSPPTQPIVTPTNTTINQNQSQTYTVTNPTAGVFYGIADAITGKSLATGVWATSGSQFDLVTAPITTSGTIDVIIKATSLSSTEMCSITSASRTVTVNPVVLPVTLIYFGGKLNANAADLQWITAMEQNTQQYVVERSTDGISFMQIGSVAATNRSGGATYDFTDQQPALGVNYYRIKMIDMDGRYTYSKVIALQTNGNNIIINSVHPNPFSNGLNISVQLAKAQKLQVLLLDANGRLAKQKTINAQTGVNNISLTELHNLPAGMYMLHINNGEKLLQQKVMKANK